MACFLAEWYRTELTENAIGSFATLLETTAEAMSAEATPIRLLMTLSVPADDALYGVFEAETSEAILRTCTRAGALPHRLTPQVQTWIAGVASRPRGSDGRCAARRRPGSGRPFRAG